MFPFIVKIACLIQLAQKQNILCRFLVLIATIFLNSSSWVLAWHSGEGMIPKYTISICVWLPAGVIMQRNHTEKRVQPLLLSDILLLWKPDVISDDMKLMYMALTACLRRTEINSLLLSALRNPQTSADLCSDIMSLMTILAFNDLTFLVVIFHLLVSVTSHCFFFVSFQDALQDWTAEKTDCL